jgi:hypothetical protein
MVLTRSSIRGRPFFGARFIGAKVALKGFSSTIEPPGVLVDASLNDELVAGVTAARGVLAAQGSSLTQGLGGVMFWRHHHVVRISRIGGIGMRRAAKAENAEGERAAKKKVSHFVSRSGGRDCPRRHQCGTVPALGPARSGQKPARGGHSIARRAPTMRSKPGPPMTLANMRQNGVRMLTA